jgi:hypothetical protein
MAGHLTVVSPAARALSRQRGGPSIPSWVLATTVQGTQLHGWSPHWWDSRCSCFVTAAWRSQHPFLGAGDHSVGDSAAWLVPSLVGCPLLVLCHCSVVFPASLPGCWRPQCRGLSGLAGHLTGVIPAARALSRQRGGPSILLWVLVTTV